MRFSANIDEDVISWKTTKSPIILNTIITKISPLVYSIAHKYNYKQYDIDILVSEGFIGVLHALDKFATNNISFISYAYYWIKSKIMSFASKISININNNITVDYQEDQDAYTLTKCFNLLPIAYKNILESRYFFNKTLIEVAQEHNITFAQVRYIEQKAIDYLKSMIINEFRIKASYDL